MEIPHGQMGCWVCNMCLCDLCSPERKDDNSICSKTCAELLQEQVAIEDAIAKKKGEN